MGSVHYMSPEQARGLRSDARTDIVVVGDAMLDRFLYGSVDRISPEAPVPVVRLGRSSAMPGGAGNVARNISALGGKAALVALLGEDAAAAELRALLAADPGIDDATVSSAADCRGLKPPSGKNGT